MKLKISIAGENYTAVYMPPRIRVYVTPSATPRIFRLRKGEVANLELLRLAIVQRSEERRSLHGRGPMPLAYIRVPRCSKLAVDAAGRNAP
jgi:hypothetical protein